MASYLKQGARIPRRGEIGISADSINRFEREGYVMSGNRHAAMNAVRMRKEAQVAAVEDRQRILREGMEARRAREEEIVRNFKSLINERTQKGLALGPHLPRHEKGDKD